MPLTDECRMSLFDVEKLLGNWKDTPDERHDTSRVALPRKISCRQLDSGHLVIRIDFDFRRSLMQSDAVLQLPIDM